MALSLTQVLKFPLRSGDSRLTWSAAWRWWRDGLLAWLPPTLQHRLQRSERQLVLTVTADAGYVLAREERGQSQPLEDLGAVLDGQSLRAWLSTEQPQRFVVRFPAHQVLVRLLNLPVAADKNLRQVTGFEMDRLTPFAAGQVYYDVVVLERQTEQRRLRAELTALPRAAVDPALNALRQWGLVPDALEIQGGRPGLNLMPPEQRPRRGFWRQRGPLAVMAVSLVLMLLAALLPIWQQRVLVLQSLEKIERAQSAANQALALRDQLDKALADSRMLAQKKQSAPTKIELLRELTTLLPDDTFLERVQLKGDTGQLIGQSGKALALIGILESSRLFSSVGFTSPVTNDPRTNKDRFVLSTHIGWEP